MGISRSEANRLLNGERVGGKNHWWVNKSFSRGIIREAFIFPSVNLKTPIISK